MPNWIYALLWLFVFTTPWDNIPIPLFGSLSRAVGVAVMAPLVFFTIMRGRIRKPDWVLLFSIAFAAWSAMSLLWTNSFNATVAMVFSYAQLIVLVAIVRELVKTREQEESLFVAYFLGCFVPMASLLYNFYTDVRLSADRFAANKVNADDLSLTLVLGLPMAWQVVRQRRGLTRAIALVYFILAPISTLLTATRGAFLSGLVALSIVPLTMNVRVSLKSMARAAVLLVVVGAAVAAVVPETSWQRIGSISTEFGEGGRLNGRREVWLAGLNVLPSHPYIGFGAGAYGRATQSLLNTDKTYGHNFFLTMAVELGGIGLLLIVSLLAAIALTIVRLPSPERMIWAVVMLAWVIGVMSVNWEIRKTTWLLFGFVAAHGSLELTRRRTATPRISRGIVHAPQSDAARLPSPAWSRDASLAAGWPPRSITKR